MKDNSSNQSKRKSYKLYGIIFLLVVLFCLLLFIGNSLISATKNTIHHQEVSRAITNHLDKYQQTNVNLSEALGFEWDEMVIVAPYTDPSTLGLDLKSRLVLELINIESRDDLCVLIFKKKGKVVLIDTEPRNYDFCNLSKKIYSATEAEFEIQRKHGYDFVLEDSKK
jgi:hypothetical protein